MEAEEKNYLYFDISGKDPELFKKLSSKLEDEIIVIINKLSKSESNTSSKEIVHEVINAAQTFIEAKLKEPSISNKKLLAEITRTYAEAEEKLAASREKNALAEGIEIDNIRKRLEMAMHLLSFMGKIEMIRKSDKTIIAFTKNDLELPE